jgi:hypothetical protein
MDKKAKDGKQGSDATTVHPETQRHVKRGVADQSSSKARPNQKSDARGGHDKDANSEQAPAGGRG